MIPVRKPVGRTFCPMRSPRPCGSRFGVGQAFQPDFSHAEDVRLESLTYDYASVSSAPSDSVMRMCEYRRLIGYAVPRARGWMRFMIGPPSTQASTMVSSSMLRAPRSSALPRALLSTASTRRALLLGMNCNSSSASSASRPRINVATGRIFRGDMSAYRCFALYCMTASRLLVVRLESLTYFDGHLAAFLPPECPLKIRVGANSPSLCPTMSSVTYSFMNCRPLWIRKVWPTNSGTMVQSRAHVLIGSRFLARSFFSTFARSRSSKYGPFL